MLLSILPAALIRALCWSALLRRAERYIFSESCVIADAECRVLLSWVDSTRIISTASRIIHSTSPQHNRGAAGRNFESMRSADITLELTRERTQP